MPHRRGGAALQVLDAPHIGADDGLRLQGFQLREFAVAQLGCQLGLQYRVGACRAAAQMAFNCCQLHFKTQFSQLRFNVAAQLLAMLQSAGRMKCQLGFCFALAALFQLGFDGRHHARQHFTQINR